MLARREHYCAAMRFNVTIHRLGVGMGIFGIGDMLGIGDIGGMFMPFMSAFMDAQQSFDWAVGASAFIIE